MIVPRRLWLGLLCAGAPVWLASAVITAVTRDAILVPTVILVGSFLVPLTMVTFALSRAPEPLSFDVVLVGFVGAGALGVVLSALTETYLLPSAYGTFLSIGLIEEVTKGLVVVAVALRLPTRDPRAGMVLGATVGAGFAAFESAGYALSAVIGHSDDHPVRRIVETEAFRALLAPFGHISWTALFGGALFAAAAGRSFRLNGAVLGTLAGIVVLHGAWDASYGWAIMIAQGVGGEGWNLTWPNTQAWIGSPTGGTLLIFQVAYDGLVALCGVVGATWVVHRWRAYGAAVRTSAALAA
jgi:RsiW-degrading membrane proteinase PrsW (M82 family)